MQQHQALRTNKKRDIIMANTSSAKKAVRKMTRQTLVNRSRRSRVRTFIRGVEEAITAGNQSEAAEALRLAQPEIIRSAQKGIFHKNTASRKISRMAQRVKAMSAS